MKRLILFFVWVSFFFDVYSQSSSNEEYANEYNSNIKFGVFQLEEAPVIFNLDNNFKFVNGPYAREIMTEGWGNKPEAVANVVGIIIPDTTSSLIYLNKGYIVSYQEIGHVEDKDGGKFNLKGIIDENPANSYGEKIKWAWNPTYDKESHVLSLPLLYEGNNKDLVHQVKIFGRTGVISLQSLNDVQDGPWLYNHYPAILNGISFTKGNTYSDYSSSKDKIAYSSIEDFLADKPATGLQSVQGNFDLEYDSIRIMGFIALVLIAIMVFLMGLVWITKPKEETQKDILKLSSNVLLRIGVFYTVYFLILILALFIVWLGVEITIAIVTHFFSIQILVAIVVGWGVIGGFLLAVVKSLFVRRKIENKYQMQISEEDAPELFSLIKETAEKTGEKMPEKVFITPEMNASVFYNRSLIGLFFSGAKNINIGIGLLYGLSKDELRAILAHEFGHFGQKSMRMGQIVSKSNSVIYNMMDSGASIVKPVLKWTFLYVQKGYLALSRAMENEADLVAAETVGNDTMISSLCKIEVMQDRLNTYNGLMMDIFNTRKFVPESYFAGYESFLDFSSYYDGLQIDENMALKEPVLDITTSRVKLKDIWVSHPPLKERITNIRRKERKSSLDTHEEVISLVPKQIDKEISILIFGPIEFPFSQPLGKDEYKVELEKELLNRSFSLTLRPFFNRNIYPFDIESEISKHVAIDESEVFNSDNIKIINRFNQEIEDYQSMVLFRDHKAGDNIIKYDGHLYKRKTVPVETQVQRIKVMEPDIANLDKKAFHVAVSKGGDIDLLKKAYNDIFYSQGVISFIKEHILPTRDMVAKKYGSGGSQNEEQFAKTQQMLQSFRDFIKNQISTLQMERLNPILNLEMAKHLDYLYNLRLLEGFSSILGSDIEYIFTLPEQLILLFQNLSHFSKKIVTDIIEGKHPVLYWENTVAAQKLKEENN